MAKPLVIDSGEQGVRSHLTRHKAPARVPFLRGILTRSLQDAGLSFDVAYKLASSIRQELDNSAEITTPELRATVLRYLHKANYPHDIIERYRAPTRQATTVKVRDRHGNAMPFSQPQHRRRLESCGLSSEEATQITSTLYEHLLRKGKELISTRHLGLLTYRYIKRSLNTDAARRYLVWTDFLNSHRPLLLFIGGVPGSGKSTIATELANLLGIVRIQSTDMLREVMRMMMPERLLPVLHKSSYDAWRALPAQDAADADPEALLADGYLTQADLLSVPCEAVVQRALKEQVSLIIEGVHICPTLLEKIHQSADTIVVPIMLAVLKPGQLRKRFNRRSLQAPKRRSDRYMTHFDAIWHLQTFLLAEADRGHITIISNDDKELALQQVMATIIDTLSRRFSGAAKDVFQ